MPRTPYENDLNEDGSQTPARWASRRRQLMLGRPSAATSSNRDQKKRVSARFFSAWSPALQRGIGLRCNRRRGQRTMKAKLAAAGGTLQPYSTEAICGRIL